MYDFAILGGGIVGKALFAALRQAKFPIPIKGIIFDNASREPLMTEYSNRVSSINQATLPFLQSLGIDLGVRGSSLKAQPYSKMLIWYGDYHGSAIKIEQTEPIAWIVENRRLSAALDRSLADWPIAKQNATIVGEYSDKERATLNLGDQQISCNLLIGADGKHGAVAKWAGIEQIRRDYGQHGIVATVQVATASQPCAYQRFLPMGPIALLPLDHDAGIYSLVWTLPTQLAKGLLQNTVDWGKLVEAAIRYHWADCAYWTMHQAGLRGKQTVAGLDANIPDQLNLLGEQAWRQSSWSHDWWAWQQSLPRILEVSNVASFPLQTQLATRLIKPGVALIGDAAHTVHPMAGQGLNLGLGDAQVLAEELIMALSRGQLAGELGVLENYQRRRATACLGMAGAIHGMHSLFHGDPHSTLRWDILPRAMHLFNRLDPLKRLPTL